MIDDWAGSSGGFVGVSRNGVPYCGMGKRLMKTLEFEWQNLKEYAILIIIEDNTLLSINMVH